ncbi:hypothetical protein DES53_102469 [Roseimicrobium gellanilyticum]|uniref:Uncharacterized protein n=1 Tax=Roseimicrobium gellanilyticum TaxID=748857 RepID=A0A366HT31_9BACT|nr:hypothetical protein DES53_102469 [Roseimicrobium gellanilyticum]
MGMHVTSLTVVPSLGMMRSFQIAFDLKGNALLADDSPHSHEC